MKKILRKLKPFRTSDTVNGNHCESTQIQRCPTRIRSAGVQAGQRRRRRGRRSGTWAPRPAPRTARGSARGPRAPPPVPPSSPPAGDVESWTLPACLSIRLVVMVFFAEKKVRYSTVGGNGFGDWGDTSQSRKAIHMVPGRHGCANPTSSLPISTSRCMPGEGRFICVAGGGQTGRHRRLGNQIHGRSKGSEETNVPRHTHPAVARWYPLRSSSAAQ